MRKRKPDPWRVMTGRRGGKARLTKMTPEQRSEIARLGALAKHANWLRKQGLAPDQGAAA